MASIQAVAAETRKVSLMTTMTVPHAVPPRELVVPGLFERLSRRVQKDEELDEDTADRVVEQALGFLLACALNPDARLSPSEKVDVGWHAFILHTREYAAFCEKVAGHFIHHVPVLPGEDEQGSASAADAMRAAGIQVDVGLWGRTADCNEKCHQCHAGCYDSPRGI